MRFKVLSRNRIKDFYTDKKHIVISVIDPNAAEGSAKMLDNKNRLGILNMAFHDLDEKHRNIMEIKYVFFNQEMAKKIIDFVRNFIGLDLELIICQCEAGISRSAGIAGALAKCINGDDRYIFEHFVPNMLVYSLIVKEWNRKGLS